jgi:alkylation response protein AidB-like acyl-CoA dehydrogenase
MKRELLEPEHEDFRDSFRTFLEREVSPNVEEWEREGIVPRELYAQAGEHGFVGIAVPERYGGAGIEDFRFNLVVGEEAQRVGASGAGLGLTLHNDICTPYFLQHCDEEQSERWLPGIASGELITAVAMTEPQAGSDLAAIATRAKRDGDHYVVDGAKTFITNGINADLVIVVVRTDPDEPHRGLSLLVVERDTDGFERGRNLEKIGQHSQDTAELFFDGARVPAANLLGKENEGFRYLVFNLAQERLSIAAAAVAAAEAALEWTLAYVRERQAFGRAVGTFQNTRFTLADVKTEVTIARTFIDRCVLAHNAGDLSPEDAAMAKLWCTDLQSTVTDRCLQLFGGYGYMLEYPIARAFADARVTRIYGGSNEIMKEIVGRSLGLGE